MVVTHPWSQASVTSPPYVICENQTKNKYVKTPEFQLLTIQVISRLVLDLLLLKNIKYSCKTVLKLVQLSWLHSILQAVSYFFSFDRLARKRSLRRFSRVPLTHLARIAFLLRCQRGKRDWLHSRDAMTFLNVFSPTKHLRYSRIRCHPYRNSTVIFSPNIIDPSPKMAVTDTRNRKSTFSLVTLQSFSVKKYQLKKCWNPQS